MKTIVTLTMNPAIEMFLETGRMSPGHKLHCPAPIYVPAGGGITVSRAIRRLGGTSVAIFPAGGAAGEMLATMLLREQIPAEIIRIRDTTRQDVNIVERATGFEYRFAVPGPELALEEWEQCLDALRHRSPAAEIVVASGSLPPSVPVDFYGRVAAVARDCGFRLIVDTSGEPLRHAAAPGTYILKPNVSELSIIAGGSVSQTIVEAAARSIVSNGGAEAVVVSIGAAGAMIVDRRGLRRVNAPIVPIASRSGAGDSMVAGIAVALARGWDLDDAVQFGVAAGSSAVSSPGVQVCRRDETEMLFEQMRAHTTPSFAVMTNRRDRVEV
ncbi:MAG TPA: 1-phosphofructokinase family hexose kinase [Thermoanaerobaculia bacterium]|nr:1-phosphofructokinase family hexose kinase [Thermoanaerobaculia bacterium]